MFDVSLSTVSSTFHRIIPALWRYFRNQATWPTMGEWNALRGIGVVFPMPLVALMAHRMKLIAWGLSRKLHFVVVITITIL